MSDSIDTEVEGEPGQIREVALGLRNSTTPAIEAVGDTLVDARRESGDTWNSPAGEAFHSHTSSLIDPVDGLESYLRDAANGLELLAGELENSQSLMESIRTDAANAGLSVNGLVIENPGAPLPSPGPLPVDADTTAVALHRDQVSAHNVQNARISAFTSAAAEASEVRAKETAAARSWGETVSRKHQLKLAFTGADFGVSVAKGLADERGAKHKKASQSLMARSTKLSELRASVTDFDKRRAMFTEGRKLHGEAARHQAGWRSANKSGQKFGRAGGVLAVGGVAYDIAVLDKPWTQAAVSGGAGFAASVGTAALAGAVIGSAFPVPLVGTVAGAGLGVAAGIYTSGAVDSLFEDADRSVAGAFEAGHSALVDTGVAAWNASSSAWKSLF